VIGAAFGLGFVAGPAIGGLLGQFGPRVPFFAAAAVSGMNLIFGYFVLPETLDAKSRRPFEWARSNPIGTFKVFSRYRAVLPLCIVLFGYFFATSVYSAVWAFWGIARFGWSPSLIGLTLAAFGITMAITQGALTEPAVRWLGERKVASVGIAAAILAAAGYTIAPNLVVVLILLVVHAPEGFIHPMLTAMMTKEVPEDAQGELQGGLSSLMSVSMLFGTVFYTQLFGYLLQTSGRNFWTGIPYGIAAALMVLTGAYYFRYLKAHPDT
jgi:DHA1 family tetracycline resistance protein-like MFS transporter